MVRKGGPSVWDNVLVYGTMAVIAAVAFYTFYTIVWR